jgi:hypothetical protein
LLLLLRDDDASHFIDVVASILMRQMMTPCITRIKRTPGIAAEKEQPLAFTKSHKTAQPPIYKPLFPEQENAVDLLILDTPNCEVAEAVGVTREDDGNAPRVGQSG